MDDTKRCITVLHRIHNNPHGEEIVDLIQGFILLHHLFVDAEEMLHAPIYLALDSGIVHMALHLIDNPLHKCLPGILPEGDLF